MVRKRRTKTSAIKYACCAACVLCVIGLALWCTASDSIGIPVMVGGSVAVAFGLALWAFVEQFRYSFGTSRYPTRTQRKRLLHRRKNKGGVETILGREIPERYDR